MRKYPIDQVLTHIDPHEDELNAYSQACHWGRDHFPGIRSAKIALVGAGLRVGLNMTHVDWLHKGSLLIGVGGGHPRPGVPCIDEHGLPSPLREKHSAATLMAEYLGRHKDKALQPLLAYSLRADKGGYSDPFELGSVITLWHARRVPLQNVVAMYRTMFEALYTRFCKSTIEPFPVPFKQLVARWLIAAFGGPAHAHLLTNGEQFDGIPDLVARFDLAAQKLEALDEIIDLASRQELKACEAPFNLIGMTHAMLTTGVPVGEVERILFTTFSAKFADTLDYILERKHFTEQARYLNATSTPEHPLVYAVIESDANNVKRAAKREDPALAALLQIRSTGNIQVFRLAKASLDLTPVAARLRALLRDRRGLPPLDNSLLCQEGTIREVPEVHNFVEHGHVFNGSKTTMSVPPIICPGGLKKEEVIRCFREGIEHIERRKRPRSTVA